MTKVWSCNIPHINFVQLIHVKIKMRKVVHTFNKETGIHKYYGSLVAAYGRRMSLYISSIGSKGHIMRMINTVNREACPAKHKRD